MTEKNKKDDPKETPVAAEEPVDAGTLTKDDRTWAMLAHLLTLSGLIIPFGNVIAPLVIYLIKKDEMPFVVDQAKEALNFQITVTALYILCIPLSFFFCVGLFIAIPVAIAQAVFAVIGGIKANEGVKYRYPLTIRIIK